MPQTIKYANVLAKIGVERSNLLTETKIKMLTEKENLIDFSSNLKDTTYGEKISNISIPISSRKLERVFQERLIEDYVKIIKNSPKTAMIFLKTYLRRVELENLKTIIKGIQAELSFEEKKARIYMQAEIFLRRQNIFEDASKASDFKQLIESFKRTEYLLALNQGIDSYEENGTTACLDMLLDKVFYEKLHEAFRQLSRKEQHYAEYYESAEENSYTLLTLLRGKNLNFDANWLRTILPQRNSTLSKKIVESMTTAESFESALSIILQSPFGVFFSKAQTPEETIASGEKNFRKKLLVHAFRNRIPDVFNIGLPIAFMIQKEAEVRNLNSISLGIEAGMTPQEIQNNLLFSH